LTIRIAHLSDIHFGDEITGAVQAAAQAVAVFQPTLTIVTGDLTLGGRPAEFRAAAQWLERLPQPLMVMPGNHDTPYWNLIPRIVTPFARYRHYIGATEGPGFDAPGLAARCLNSARGAQPRLNWSRGAISLDRLRAINWDSAGPADLRVFACHHPLLFLPGAPVEGGVRRGDEAMKELARAGVDVILSGHVHNPFVLAAPGCETGVWAIGAGTLSRRLRGTPASFTTLVASGETLEVTTQAWIDGAFKPDQVWSVARRSPRLS
jgi:3',5'-cyclic AMP phosphodiesterase CpdA